LQGANSVFPFLSIRDALSPLLLNFSLECAVRKIHEKQVGLKLNETHQLLAYADDVNLLGGKCNFQKFEKLIQRLIG
jgi:hypothetical protein